MRVREEPGKVLSGALSLGVHLLFLALLVFGVSWQARQPDAVMVDVWSSLPNAEHRPAQPRKSRVEERPVEQKPVRDQPETKPQSSLKAEIEFKAKQEEKRRKTEKLKQEQDKLKQVQQKQAQQEKIQQQQESMRQQQLQNELARARQAQQATMQQGVVDDYKGRIRSKIRRYVKQQLCGEGNPELEFDISLMPTGQLLADPQLRKGSGIAACDRAVETAIIAAQPLPLPPQPDIRAQFSDLHLKFRPNEER